MTVATGALEDAAIGVAAADALDEATTEIVAADALDEAAGAADTSVPSEIALLCAAKVVETMGQPAPGPCKFCKVTAAALSLASLEFLLSSVGKEIPTVGLLMT